MLTREARGFLRFGAIACVLGAVLTVVDALLPQDGGAIDLVTDLGASLDAYVLVGLAWGLIALRPGPLTKVAAALLLLNALAVPVILLAGPTLFTLHVMVWLWAGANAVLAAALAWGTPRDLRDLRGLIVALVAAASAFTAVLVGEDELTRLESVVVTDLALAALFWRASWRAPAPADATLGAWRRTETGVGLVVMGERGRLVILVGGFVFGLVLRKVDGELALMTMATLAHLATIGLGAAGLAQMRDAPAGRPWALAALAMALIAFLAVACEVAGLLMDADLAIIGAGSIARHIGQCGLAAFAALALGALGDRAGLPDARREGPPGPTSSSSPSPVCRESKRGRAVKGRG